MFLEDNISVSTLKLCCPLCKNSNLSENIEGTIHCPACGTEYFTKEINTGPALKEKYKDFRIHSPAYCKPAAIKRWEEAQAEYIRYHNYYKEKDPLAYYLKEIDSVKEIYTEEFLLSGKILDVGGNQGRLRHYLQENEETLKNYISIDPFPEVFQNIALQTNLLQAYPVLKEPVIFIAGVAEHLPFPDWQFDWVHMRSVIDHFYDPFSALKEAYRVLKPGGQILIGVSIKEGAIPHNTTAKTVKQSFAQKLFTKIRTGKLDELAGSAVARMKKKIFSTRFKVKKDDHIFDWSYENLVNLLKVTNFAVEKVHWQKPPYTNVVYIAARKS